MIGPTPRRRPVLPSARLRLWAGELLLWPGRGLYVGRAADTALHAHHAVQICVGLDGDFALRAGAGRWRRHRAALVTPDTPHQLDGLGTALALLYLDPESDDARRLARGPSGIRSLPAPELDSGAPPAALAQALLSQLVPAQGPRAPLDARIARSVAHLRTVHPPRLPAAEVARAVGLSVGRFGHLFRNGTGVPLRRYLLWLRLLAAVDAIAGGASLTDCAHSAGFADAAHMSRTFRRMFGIAPSMLRLARR